MCFFNGTHEQNFILLLMEGYLHCIKNGVVSMLTWHAACAYNTDKTSVAKTVKPLNKILSISNSLTKQGVAES